VTRVIDIHIHVPRLDMLKPAALEVIKRDRRNYADVERFSADPAAFLKFLDDAGIERAGLINYVSPDVIGSTPEINDWVARYCSAAPEPTATASGRSRRCTSARSRSACR